jgi:hypothetical protein
MRKLLNKPWFVSALALTACAVVWNSVRPGHNTVVTAGMEEAATATAETAENTTTASTAGMPMDEILKGLTAGLVPRDPFAARPREMATSLREQPTVPDFVDTLKLSAIWTQEGRTFVIINGQIHQVGDEISRIKIESASLDGVWLAHWKGRDFVTLGSNFTLVTPSRRSMPVASL